MLLPKFTRLVLVYFIAGFNAHPASDTKQKVYLKDMTAGKSLTASSFLTEKAPARKKTGATNSENDDFSAEERTKPESLPGGRSLSLPGTNVVGTLSKPGEGNSSIIAELPKYAKMVAQTGRMFTASLIAPKEPELKVRGRTMDQGAKSVGESSSGYMYSVRKSWSSKNGDNDTSGEESSSHIQIGNGTKELFASSMLGSKLGEYMQGGQFNLKDFKKDFGASGMNSGGGTVTRFSTLKQSGGSYQIGGFGEMNGGGGMSKIGLNQGEMKAGDGPIIRISANKQSGGGGPYQIGEIKLGAMGRSDTKISQPPQTIGGFAVEDGGMSKLTLNQNEMKAGDGPIIRISANKQSGSGGPYQIGEIKLGAMGRSDTKISQPPQTIHGFMVENGDISKLGFNQGEMNAGDGPITRFSTQKQSGGSYQIGGFGDMNGGSGMSKIGLNQGEMKAGDGPIIRISTNKQSASGGPYQIGEIKLGAGAMSKLSDTKISQPPQTIGGFMVEDGGMSKLGLNQGEMKAGDGPVIRISTNKQSGSGGPYQIGEIKLGAMGRSVTKIAQPPQTIGGFMVEDGGMSKLGLNQGEMNGIKDLGSVLGSKIGEYMQEGKFNLKEFKKDFGPGETKEGGGTITRFSTHKQSGGSYQIGGFGNMNGGSGMSKIGLNQGEMKAGDGPIIRISANKQSGGGGPYQIGEIKLGAMSKLADNKIAQPPQPIGGKDGGGGMSIKIGLNQGAGAAPPPEADVDEEDGEGDAGDVNNGEEVGDEFIPDEKKRKKYKKTTTIKKTRKSSNFTAATANLQFRKGGMGQQGRSLSSPKNVFAKQRPTGDSQPAGRSLGGNDDEPDELPKHAVLAHQTGRMFAASLLAPKALEPGIRGRSLMGAPVLSTTTEKPRTHTKAKLPGAFKHKNDYTDDSTEDMPKPLTKKSKNLLLAPSVLQVT